MPRSRRAARGTRGVNKVSAVTFQTNYSGVTLDASGIHFGSGQYITPTQVGYLDGTAGQPISRTATTGIKMVHGITDAENSWGAGLAPASNIAKVTTGLTNLICFMANVYLKYPHTTGGVSACAWHLNGSAVSVSGLTNKGAAANWSNGSSVAWIAFGT